MSSEDDFSIIGKMRLTIYLPTCLNSPHSSPVASVTKVDGLAFLPSKVYIAASEPPISSTRIVQGLPSEPKIQATVNIGDSLGF